MCERGENLLLDELDEKKFSHKISSKAKQEQFSYGFICHPQVPQV